MRWRVLTTPALFGAAFLVAGAVNTPAQTAETGFLNRAVLMDGAEFRYQVYVPPDFRRSTSWPVVLALHGGGEYGSDGLRQTGVGLIWLFHGDTDETVPVAESRRMAGALKAMGADVRYTELAGVGHNAWDPAYDRADLMEWLLKQRRRQ